MAQITTLDSVSKLLKYVTITLPPFVTKNEDSYIRQFLSSILEVFKINIDQLNQMFNNTFISQAEDGDLEKLILDVSNVTRKDGESDEDYRNRFYKYVYQYNATTNSIKEIIYDSLGYYPIKLTESGARTAYWGLEDLPLEDRVANSAYFYDDVNEYTAYWGNYQSQEGSFNERYFIGTIHLIERPPQDKLDELCDIIERVRKKGTKIYLQFLDDINIILEPVITIVEEDAFTFAWRLVPSAFSYEIQIDDDPLFGSPTTYITSSTSYTFSGLSGGTTYYTRVRYENDDGYSEWSDPVETTTESSIGTPIATEETSVTTYGFTANWGSASGATSYLLTVATDLALTLPISGLNQLNVGNVVSYDINKYTEERILFMRGTDVSINFQGNLYSCKIDGSDLQQHTITERVFFGATFVKNGDIVYSRDNGSGINKLYIIKKSENYSTEYELLDSLGNPLPFNNQQVKASKTLNKIAYLKEDPPATTDLYVFDLDSKIEIALELESNRFYLPYFNENSTYIYAMTIDGGGSTAESAYIKKIKLSDGSITTVVNNNRPSLFPTIDKNEQYLFYAYNSNGLYADDVDRIRRYKLDGSEDIDIITVGTTNYYSMGINNDNNKLYFCNKRSPHATKFQLYKANFDGTSEALLFGSVVAYNDYFMDMKEITYDSNEFPSILPLTTLYYAVKATDGVNTSPYSNKITVVKPT